MKLVFSDPVMIDSGGTPSWTITGLTERAVTPWASAVGRKPALSTSALMR